MNLLQMGQAARTASRQIAALDGQRRAQALCSMADALLEDSAALLVTNAADVEAARAQGTAEGYLDRLTLNPDRLRAIADGLREIATLPDPLAIETPPVVRPNGLSIMRVRVPLGVVGIIYEARPNVTADAAGLCLMSGNACILRGGSEAVRSNAAIVASLQRALESCGIDRYAVQLVEDTSREVAREMMRMRGAIDVLIPRGGAGLIRSVVENASVPVIETGTGVCHTYVDGGCTDFAMARAVVRNAKCSRPSVCNALETLLVDRSVAASFLPTCLEELRDAGVALRGCDGVRALAPWVAAATEEDWDTEYGDLTLAVRIVDGVQGAIGHIEEHGTGHSECILTQDTQAADTFLRRVDAAAVYHNASTRFTDGYEFGLGAEIGISNQKLHARGPMGLAEMTTYKYVIEGEGQIR